MNWIGQDQELNFKLLNKKKASFVFFFFKTPSPPFFLILLKNCVIIMLSRKCEKQSQKSCFFQIFHLLFFSIHCKEPNVALWGWGSSANTLCFFFVFWVLNRSMLNDSTNVNSVLQDLLRLCHFSSQVFFCVFWG